MRPISCERGVDVSYGTIRFWTLKFGPAIAAILRRGRSLSTGRWRRAEMVVRIVGRGCGRQRLRSGDHGKLRPRAAKLTVPAPIGGARSWRWIVTMPLTLVRT